MRSAYTYALLEVSPACYDEIRALLAAAGYQQAFHADAQGTVVIDMRGLALCRRLDEETEKEQEEA